MYFHKYSDAPNRLKISQDSFILLYNCFFLTYKGTKKKLCNKNQFSGYKVNHLVWQGLSTIFTATTVILVKKIVSFGALFNVYTFARFSFSETKLLVV